MHFISNLFSQQDLIKLENWRIKSVKKIFLHGDFMMNLKVICVRRLRQIANWWSLLHESWMNVCLCVWPDIYITWLSSSWFPCSPSLVSWGQRHRVEGINMILTTDTAPARQAPGHQGLCRIATLAWPGSLAIKLVFYCQPRHNLPLIINLPHSSRDWLTGLSPLFVSCPLAAPDHGVSVVWDESLPCVENFKSGHRVRVLCSGAELSELGRTEPLAECPQAGPGLGRGWRLGSGGCSCVRSETRHQEPLVLVRLSCESCELWVRDWDHQRQPETRGTRPSPVVCSPTWSWESESMRVKSDRAPEWHQWAQWPLRSRWWLCWLLAAGLSWASPGLSSSGGQSSSPPSRPAPHPGVMWRHLSSSPSPRLTTPRAACCWWW